jgi:hypothetical protein
MACYKSGRCEKYETLSCNKCPANKPEYILKENHINIYVAVINGKVKDNYMAIGLTEENARQNVVNAYFGDTTHNENNLQAVDCYITVTAFINGQTTSVF